MNNSAISKFIVVVVGLILGLIAITSTMADTMSGGIGTALRFVMVILIPLIFSRPRFGLYVLVILLANIEWIKRLAIYYGVANVVTATEMLVIPIIVLGILVLSMFAGWVSGANKMSAGQFALFMISGLMMLIILAIRGRNPLGAQAAINTGLYISMVPILLILMKDKEDFLKFMSFCVWMFLPWALWGIKQYYFGLNDVESHYVRTNISPVLTGEVMSAIGNPRPFGLASSQASYGAISFITWFCIWRTLAIRKKRYLYGLATIFFFSALVLSGQRTALLLPLIALPAYFLFRNKAGVIAVYASGVALLGLGVLYAGELLRNLDRIQESITIQDGGWAEKTIRVSTFSDRLRGWERLKNPEVWSLFGKRLERTSEGISSVNVSSADYAHDMLNAFLLNVGVVGLIPCLGLLVYTLFKLHVLVLRLPKGHHRSMAAAALAYSIPNVVLAIMGGGNFNTTPVNFFTWSFFAMAFIGGRNTNPMEVAPQITNPSPPEGPSGDRKHHPIGRPPIAAQSR